MIHIENLSKAYGERVLLDDVNWHVKKRDRIGLSGANGSGKTTILRILAGQEEPDSGSVRMATETTIGYLPQDGVAHHGRTLHEEVSLAFEELLALKEEQHQIEDKLASATGDDGEHEKLLERYSDVMEHFKRLGGYEIDARVAEVLRGLGFAPEDEQRPTEEFSGGWQMRIALAKLLLARPNLLLMDEPTNHLDLQARNWLEDYIRNYPGSVVLVAHDRYFLDATVLRITEVGLSTLTDYHGNYTHYVVEHEARMQRLRQSALRQGEEIEKAEAFINKFRYQATKARQVQSRIKQLDKVERIVVPPQRKRIRFRFPDAPKSGRIAFELKSVDKSYGANAVLKGVDLIFERGDRTALVGVNGAGKTTLIRVLARDLEIDAGKRVVGHNVAMDYFAQEQAIALEGSRTVYEEMAAASPMAMIPRVRSILGAFLFSGDDILKRISVLSGGERNRLALAKMLLKPSNVLLLDEPTNHLDIESKEVLLEALADYEGTIVFVSHDRYFVDQLATKVIEVGGGGVLSYPGGYEEFLDWKDRRAKGEQVSIPDKRSGRPKSAEMAPAGRRAASDNDTPSGEAPPAAPRPSKTLPREKARKAAKRANDPAPQRDPMAPRLRQAPPHDRQSQERAARKTRKRIAELEKDITQKENSIGALEDRMAAPGFYDDRAQADQAGHEHKSLKTELDALLREWEELQVAVT